MPALTRTLVAALVAALVVALVLAAPLPLFATTARADAGSSDVDDPRVQELIARVLDHIRYQAAAQSVWGTIEVDGADDLVIVVEPLDRDARTALDRLAAFERPSLLWWDEARSSRLARVRPHGRIALHNPVPEPRAFELYRGKRLLARVTAEAHADVQLGDLPEGIVRVRRVGSTVDGFIYVTPWPSRVLRAARHETFAVPHGRYRLHGWNPRGGERSVVVTAS